MSQQHPYKLYEDSGTWRALEKGIAELVKNGDLTESTPREYIVGYLTRAVRENDPPIAGKKPHRIQAAPVKPTNGAKHLNRVRQKVSK